MENRFSGARWNRRVLGRGSAGLSGPVIARIVPVSHHETAGSECAPSPAPRPHNESGDNPLPSDTERCELLIAAGEFHSQCGEDDDALHSLRDAAVIAERIGDPVRLGRAVIAMPGWNTAFPQASNPLARLLAERALALEHDSVPLRAMLSARLAAEMFLCGDEQRALEMDAQALRLCAGDPHSELYVRCCRDRILRHIDRMSERLGNAEETFRLGVACGDYAACHLAALAQCEVLAISGRIAEAHQMARLAEGIASVNDLESYRELAIVYRSACAVLEGRLEAALEIFSTGKALGATGRNQHLIRRRWPVMLVPMEEKRRLCDIEFAAQTTVRRQRGVAVYETLLGWIRARSGRAMDASFTLQRFAADRFAAVSASEQSLVSLAALADVAVELNRPDCAEPIYQRMAPYAGLATTIGSVAGFGSVALHLGRLASLMGRVEDAVAHLRGAIESNRRVGARPWAAYSSYELARVLAKRGRNSDREQALELAAAVESEARGLGMARLERIAGEMRERLGSGESPDDQSGRTRSPARSDGAVITESCASGRAATRDRGDACGERECCAPAAVAGERFATFHRNGEYWLVGTGSQRFSLKHRGGLGLICCLLRHPGQEICAIQMGTDGEVCADGAALNNAARSEPPAPILDSTAKESYRSRLHDLRAELEEARDFNDLGRAARIEQEIEFITRELARALGLAGRDRKFGSEAERARKRVSLAIKEAIRVIARHDAFLGRRLARSIRTGTMCCYTPDPETPLVWQF